MTNYNIASSPRATTAIAAFLALTSTTAFAQDAAPTAPEPAPAVVAPAPAPATPPLTIVLPDPAPVAAAPAPAAVTDAAPEAAPAAVTPRAARPAARALPARQPTATRAAPVAVAPLAAAPAAVPAPAVEPAPAPEMAAAQAPAPAQAPADGNSETLIALAAGVLGIGAIAALMRRRRRTVVDEPLAYEPAYEPVAAEPVAVVPSPLVEPPAPLPSARVLADPPRVDHGDARPVFVMPAGPVPTGEARRELIQRMIAARPDEANPFKQRKARHRRAVQMLRDRETELRDRATQPFDYRQYRPTGANVPARTTVTV